MQAGWYPSFVITNSNSQTGLENKGNSLLRYQLFQRGRMPVDLDGNTQECMAQVRYIARQELKRAKAKYGQAFLHKLGPCSYSITLAKDIGSALWTDVSLVSCP